MGSIGFPARVTPIFNGESVCQVVQAGVSDFTLGKHGEGQCLTA